MLNKIRMSANSIAIVGIFSMLAFLISPSAAWGKDLKKCEFQKGMCFVTWSANKYSTDASDASMKEVKLLGTKWVSILITWYQENCSTSKIYPAERTPTDESLIHAIKTAHSLGMKVMIKPHLDIVDTSNGTWRGDICVSEPEWKLWFENYRDFIVHYAKIAQENDVEMICVGTELSSISTVKPEMWKEIVIKPVRAAYKGPLTYAANWDEEYRHVSFWDALDYIGIDAYFPLSEKDEPNLEEITKGWDQWVKDIEELQKKYNKPVIFPEVGYCSADGTARTPWEELAAGKVNLKLQADCYEALFQTFWTKPWFYGMYWWRWGTDTRFGGRGNRGYSLQNKPAKDVVKSWYGKSVPKKTPFSF